MLIKANYKQENGKYYNIKPESITYIEQDGDYHKLHTEGKSELVFHGNSYTIMERFPNLIRCHRSYYINPDMIYSLAHLAGNMVEVVFKDNSTVSFSRSKNFHNDFLTAITNEA